MILEFFKNFFTNNGFEIMTFKIRESFVWETYLAKRKEGDKKIEFFLVIDKEQGESNDLYSLLSKDIPDMFKAVEVQPFSQGEFNKNTTLLICYNGKPDHPEMIWEIEEDPYHFKKNVLCYSDEQLADLESMIASDFSIGNLNKLLYDVDKFKNMKENSAEPGYTLLNHLFVKLPFLKYNVSNKVDFSDLSGIIIEELKKENLADFCRTIKEIDWDSSEARELFLKKLDSHTGGHHE